MPLRPPRRLGLLSCTVEGGSWRARGHRLPRGIGNPAEHPWASVCRRAARRMTARLPSSRTSHARTSAMSGLSLQAQPTLRLGGPGADRSRHVDERPEWTAGLTGSIRSGAASQNAQGSDRFRPARRRANFAAGRWGDSRRPGRERGGPGLSRYRQKQGQGQGGNRARTRADATGRPGLRTPPAALGPDVSACRRGHGNGHAPGDRTCARRAAGLCRPRGHRRIDRSGTCACLHDRGSAGAQRIRWDFERLSAGVFAPIAPPPRTTALRLLRPQPFSRASLLA